MKNTIKNISTILLTLTFGSFGTLLTASHAIAATASADTTVIVNDACTFTGDFSGNLVVLAPTPGTSANSEEFALTSPTVSCNNINGFQIKAVGFSPNASNPSGVEGATAMYNANGTIPTGTTGTDSHWAFKITSATASTTATIQPGYNSYTNVPSSNTPVIQFAGSTTAVVTGSFRPDYMVSVSATQPSGEYTGAVKYTVVGL